jgi:hypothetical protein
VPVGGTAVFRRPHSAPLSSGSGAREGITTDSSDSTTLWIGSDRKIRELIVSRPTENNYIERP